MYDIERLDRAQFVEFVGLDEGVEAFQLWRERLGLGVEVDEDESAPEFDPKLGKTPVLLVEILGLIHARCADHLAIEVEGPEMERTLERAAIAARLALQGKGRVGIVSDEQHPAMGADIGQRSNGPLLVPHDDQRFAEELDREIVAGVSDLLDATDAEPAPES